MPHSDRPWPCGVCGRSDNERGSVGRRAVRRVAETWGGGSGGAAAALCAFGGRRAESHGGAEEGCMGDAWETHGGRMGEKGMEAWERGHGREGMQDAWARAVAWPRGRRMARQSSRLRRWAMGGWSARGLGAISLRGSAGMRGPRRRAPPLYSRAIEWGRDDGAARETGQTSRPDSARGKGGGARAGRRCTWETAAPHDPALHTYCIAAPRRHGRRARDSAKCNRILDQS